MPHASHQDWSWPFEELRDFAGRHGHKHGGHRHGPPGGPPGGGPGGFGPFGGGFPWNFFRRGQRARRGDVRAAILALLNEQPRNGYQIITELEQRSQGVWRPSPGAIYPALQQLEDEGLVRAETSGTGRTFTLTDVGREYVKAHPDEVAAPWEAIGEAGGGADIAEFMANNARFVTALRQVWHAGTPAQIDAARRVVNNATRELYRILAQDESEGDNT